MEGLVRTLRRIDGRGYKAYKDLKGSYRFEGWTLHVDHVQGDPFAAPTKMRLRVPQDVAKMPPALFDTRARRIAFQDFLARAVRDAIPTGPRRGTGKSGLVTIDAGAQEVLERTAVVVAGDWVEARIEVGLPAAGRTILGREAETILVHRLPAVVDGALRWERIDGERARDFVRVVDDFAHLQRALPEHGLVAFVADGAVLPRASGASDVPMPDAVPFRSPDSLRVSLPLPGGRAIAGMGVFEGVTLIVGGGYHGKSTVLKAIERGVYPHIPGDGREAVVARADAVKIRAEDGRRVSRVDISPFIQNLPLGRSTADFSSEDASGSTSQAANIIEAIEVGAKVLLLDEDTSATNFMVRDARMQALVAKDREPILPFLDRVRELYERLGVSTVLVMGGSGDYFEPADNIIRMTDYLPEEVTAEAKRIASERPSGRQVESEDPITPVAGRRPDPSSIDPSRGRRDVKIEARGRDQIVFGRETVDLRAAEQLVDPSQTRAAGYAMYLAATRFSDAPGLDAMMDRLEALFDDESLDVLAPFGRPGEHPGNFARPRRFEIAAGLNRLRSVEMEPV
jgi:predicted ABC-class ATPase